MPGSLLNLREVHSSDQSDISAKSADSKASGKKVSFNKAVRVKQYPWRPDEYHDSDGSISLPSQRFWFKVYRTSPTPETNSWNDVSEKTIWTDEYIEDSHDSLTPIAEVEDISADADRKGPAMNNEQRNGSFLNSHPAEPPIDYMDDEAGHPGNNFETFSEFGKVRNKLRTTDSFTGAEIRDSSCERRKSASDNGHVSPERNFDFRRPTISSAAKCSVDRNANKQSTNNVRLPRMAVKEQVIDNSRSDSPKYLPKCKPRERRSRSSDNDLDGDRSGRSPKRADKAVSTDDLTTNSKKIEESRPWWSQKANSDKATQCSDTLTRAKKSPDGSKISKHSALSNGRFLASVAKSTDTEIRSESYPDQHSCIRNDKPLLLRGKNCITGNKRYGVQADGEAKGTTTWFNSRSQNDKENRQRPGSYSLDKVEYDYVSDPLVNLNNVNHTFRQQKLSDTNYDEENDSRRKVLSPGHELDIITKTNDIRSAGTVGYLRGKQIPSSHVGRHLFTSPSTKIRGNRNFSYEFDGETNRGKKAPFFTPSYSEKSSPTKKGSRYCPDDTQSMIDWSLSGFRLAARSDNISSSSDSECVVHRRPPLLMYIPGVSHHNRPAVEDDRLSAISGMSRSEAEDDLSPLTTGVRGEFKRRHSMPRNGKLNWLKWKANKKNF